MIDAASTRRSRVFLDFHELLRRVLVEREKSFEFRPGAAEFRERKEGAPFG